VTYKQKKHCSCCYFFLLKRIKRLCDIIVQVFDVFQTDGKTDQVLGDIHLAALLRREITVNRAGGVDCKRSVLKKVSCPLEKPESVHEIKTISLQRAEKELADTQKALIWKLVPDQGFSF